MTLTELMRVIDELPEDDLRHLRDYIDQRVTQTSLVHPLSPQERLRLIEQAVQIIREGMTEAELERMTADMNAEVIEPWDESEWRD